MSEQYYAYKFTDAGQSYWFSNVAHPLVLEGETYSPISIAHTPPTYSSDFSQARITVRMRDDLTVALNYVSHPPPTTTDLLIYEVLDAVASGNSLTVTRYDYHWKGKIVRVAWRDSFRAVEMTCKSKADIHFAREAMVETLNPLCRFHIGDGRCPVNIEDFKEAAVVTDISDDINEPSIEVSGLAQINDYYNAGMIRLADGDMRTVEVAETAGANKLLTLNRAFPSTSVQVGDTVDVFAGDDLTQETCTVIFGAATEAGAAWGGWKLTPNRDYQKDGIR